MRIFNHSIAALAILWVIPYIGPATALSQSPPQPNIVLLNLDDADAEMLSEANIIEHFPSIATLFRKSTEFTNAHSTTPFCAPSRAALMTGKYAFNNGCKTNSETELTSAGFEGGYNCFQRHGHDQNELGVWMKQAGYRTIHVGKYHHSAFDFQRPPGWDDFSVTLGARYFGTYRFSNINRSDSPFYRLEDNQYISHEETREALGAIDNHLADRPDQPFLLYLAPIAPHAPQQHDFPTMAEPKYRQYAEGLLLPTDAPSYDEADLSDKASFLQRGPLKAFEKESLQVFFVNRLRAMKSVDDMVGSIVERLQQSGQWSNTYFILTSDNGYSLGHHRLNHKKQPYERGYNIPLFAVSPNTKTHQKASHLIAHIDICPTILELAGAEIPSDLDGKSFASLIDNSESFNPAKWQRSIMIENWAEKYVLGKPIPMAYTAERFYDQVHIAWSNGHHEYYILSEDPYQLESVYYDLEVDQQESLNNSLLNFRKQDVVPQITLTAPKSGSQVGRNIEFTGYMEDNSVPLMARLAVQSYRTKRYFNGRYWQDNYVSIPVAPSSVSTSINSWKHDLRVFSETTNNFDFLVSWVIPLDDSMQRGPLKFTVNSIDGNSIFAEINPTINGRTFTKPKQRVVGFHGSYPNQKVQVVIFNRDTREFFTGEEMSTNYTALTADPLPDNRWMKTLQLPPGNYSCYARGYFNDLFQHQPSIAAFTVE